MKKLLRNVVMGGIEVVVNYGLDLRVGKDWRFLNLEDMRT